MGRGSLGSDVTAEGESPNRIPDKHPSSALSPKKKRKKKKKENPSMVNFSLMFH